ncbi:MAG: lysophospholipid acyltransferase family protein [Bacteroidota bacterium]
MEKRPLNKRIKYTTIYYFVRFLIFIANALPRKAWLYFCGLLGSIAYHFFRETRELTIVHLGLAYSKERSMKEVVSLSKQVFRMLGKNAGEILRAMNVRTMDDLDKILVTHGMENFEAATAKGKGVIFLTCHLGAFDLQITNMSLRGLKPNIIGTALKDERLNEMLVQYRNAHGAIAVERGKETLRLIKTLKSRGSMAILIDQDTNVKSCFVNFFGMKAATPVGAAVLAMKTGAAVVPTYIYLAEDGLQHMHVLPEIPLTKTGDEGSDIVSNTQKYSDFIEEQIRKYPTQWVWMHERWKTRPVTSETL